MRAIGIGSPAASLEANYTLRTLGRTQIVFHLGMTSTEYRLVSLIADIMKERPSVIPSLEDMRNCDAVLILGEDVDTAPTALSVDAGCQVSPRNWQTVQA